MPQIKVTFSISNRDFRENGDIPRMDLPLSNNISLNSITISLITDDRNLNSFSDTYIEIFKNDNIGGGVITRYNNNGNSYLRNDRMELTPSENGYSCFLNTNMRWIQTIPFKIEFEYVVV